MVDFRPSTFPCRVLQQPACSPVLSPISIMICQCTVSITIVYLPTLHLVFVNAFNLPYLSSLLGSSHIKFHVLFMCLVWIPIATLHAGRGEFVSLRHIVDILLPSDSFTNRDRPQGLIFPARVNFRLSCHHWCLARRFSCCRWRFHAEHRRCLSET